MAWVLACLVLVHGTVWIPSDIIHLSSASFMKHRRLFQRCLEKVFPCLTQNAVQVTPFYIILCNEHVLVKLTLWYTISHAMTHEFVLMNENKHKLKLY